MIEEKLPGTATPKWFGHALKSLVFLSHSGNRCPSGEIAGHVCTETTLMRRVLARLVKAGIVEAREGRDGGYALAKSPESITYADVYRAIQMTEPLYAGLLDTASGGPFADELRNAFEELVSESEERLLQVLERHTIAELLAKTGSINIKGC